MPSSSVSSAIGTAQRPPTAGAIAAVVERRKSASRPCCLQDAHAHERQASKRWVESLLRGAAARSARAAQERGVRSDGSPIPALPPQFLAAAEGCKRKRKQAKEGARYVDLAAGDTGRGRKRRRRRRAVEHCRQKRWCWRLVENKWQEWRRWREVCRNKWWRRRLIGRGRHKWWRRRNVQHRPAAHVRAWHRHPGGSLRPSLRGCSDGCPPFCGLQAMASNLNWDSSKSRTGPTAYRPTAY